MNGDDVGLGAELLQGHIGHIIALGQLLVRLHIKSQQPAPEPVQNARQHPTNAPAAHDAHGFAVQVETDKVIEPEIVAAQLLIGLAQAAVEGQHEGHGVLGNGVGRIFGHTGHAQAQPVGGGQVHLVVPGGAHGHVAHAQRGQVL